LNVLFYHHHLSYWEILPSRLALTRKSSSLLLFLPFFLEQFCERASGLPHSGLNEIDEDLGRFVSFLFLRRIIYPTFLVSSFAAFLRSWHSYSAAFFFSALGQKQHPNEWVAY